jgi:hypothetical protein
MSKFFISVCWILCSLLCGHAQSQGALGPKDDDPAPPKRWAFVVGNSDYASSVLPHAVEEARLVAGVLKKLNFETVEGDNLSRVAFVAKLDALLGQLKEDDIFVFYFAGHGFNFGNENFLVPINAPITPVHDGQQQASYISVADLARQIKAINPGYILFLLDACRTIVDTPEILLTTDGATGPVTSAVKTQAGMTLWASTGIDVMEIGFATGPGKAALSSNGPGHYALTLVDLLQTPKKPFESVERDIIALISAKTDDEQIPWFSFSTAAELFLQPPETQIYDEGVTWKRFRGLAEQYNDSQFVKTFMRRYRASSFIKQARQWLAAFTSRAPQQISFTRLIGGAKAPELAWTNIMASKSKASIKLWSVAETPLAFARDSLDLSDLQGSIKMPNVALKLPQMKPSTFDLADLFAFQTRAVVTGRTAARAGADSTASLVRELQPGTLMNVLGPPITDVEGKPWLKVLTPESNEPSFVSVPQSTKIAVTDIGNPLREVYVGPLPNRLLALADTTVALNAAGELTGAGTTISWVSIATPFTNVVEHQNLTRVRAEHLIEDLEQAGIRRSSITVLESATDLDGNDLRVRFFGN